jgi:3-dehydroquinate dehydratase/shikimate dehydrogenase
MGIVASLQAPDAAALWRAAREHVAEPTRADAVELRLDHARAGEVERLPLAELGKPVIAAVHGAEGFGSFAGGVEERCALLRAAARAGAAFVDVDARFARALGPVPGARRIVSHHAKDGTPPDVARLFAEVDAAAEPADLVKVVTHAERAEDGLRVLAELRKGGRERIAFCSGERGAFTRVLAPLAGSVSTYASAGAATAPGQLGVAALRAALPEGGGSRSTRWFAVVGRPVGHSWSPRLHGALFRALALDQVYVACEPDDFARFLALAAALPFAGFSVTAPFKSDALRVAEPDPASKAIGAANTLVRAAGGGWSAANTDAEAVRGAVEVALAPRPLAGASVLVVGAGGAARAAVWSLRRARAEVGVWARDPERTRALCAELGGTPLERDAVAQRHFDVLVHATPAGTRGHAEPCAVPAEWIARGSAVVDAVYRPRATELLRRARERGARCVPGTEWFLRQAELQAACFTEGPEGTGLLAAELERACAEEERAHGDPPPPLVPPFTEDRR